MEFTYGRHARRRGRERRVSRRAVHEVLEHPHHVEHQRDVLFAYYGRVEGRPVTVVIAFDLDPPFLVTVMVD